MGRTAVSKRRSPVEPSWPQHRGPGSKPGTRLEVPPVGGGRGDLCLGVFASLGTASTWVLWALLIPRFRQWPAQLEEVLLTLGKWLKLFKIGSSLVKWGDDAHSLGYLG